LLSRSHLNIPIRSGKPFYTEKETPSRALQKGAKSSSWRWLRLHSSRRLRLARREPAYPRGPRSNLKGGRRGSGIVILVRREDFFFICVNDDDLLARANRRNSGQYEGGGGGEGSFVGLGARFKVSALAVGAERENFRLVDGGGGGGGGGGKKRPSLTRMGTK